MPVATKPTPAQRARARHDPAVSLPPHPPRGDRHSTRRNLHLRVYGVAYLIGPAIEGDPEVRASTDGTETWTILVRDVDRGLLAAMSTEALLLSDGVTIAVNDVVYVLQSVNVDQDTGTLVTLVFEDEVSWRLKQFSRFVAYRRTSKFTRAMAALRLVQEASRPPLKRMSYFIPELTDRQRIAAPAPDTGRSTEKGTGAATGYKVKRLRATAEQRAAIDGILTRSQKRRASRRVMTGAIMAATQESQMGKLPVNGIHVGLFHQNPDYGSEAKRRNTTSATDGFLDEWARIHGSVRNAPGDLGDAVEAVQRAGLGGRPYSQWEDEATATVDAWLGDDDHSDNGATKVEPYEFARGSKDGDREDSWAALGRWAEEVAWRRWAQGNVLYFVSDDELRAAAPALEIHGDEDWLLSPLGFDSSPDRPVTQVFARVLAERWGVRLGASVLVADGSTARGRYIVTETSGYMVNPEVTVTLRRPGSHRLEPANDTTSESDDSGSGDSELLDACAHISKQDHPYVYGGGHKKLSQIGPKEGLDCSSSCSLALKRAGMFHGDVAITSGVFASSWGKPGKGREFTVWAHSGHVWIEFHSGRYKRFDTVGPGERGPHLRTTARNDQERFTARHWPGH